MGAATYINSRGSLFTIKIYLQSKSILKLFLAKYAFSSKNFIHWEHLMSTIEWGCKGEGAARPVPSGPEIYGEVTFYSIHRFCSKTTPREKCPGRVPCWYCCPVNPSQPATPTAQGQMTSLWLRTRERTSSDKYSDVPTRPLVLSAPQLCLHSLAGVLWAWLHFFAHLSPAQDREHSKGRSCAVHSQPQRPPHSKTVKWKKCIKQGHRSSEIKQHYNHCLGLFLNIPLAGGLNFLIGDITAIDTMFLSKHSLPFLTLVAGTRAQWTPVRKGTRN